MFSESKQNIIDQYFAGTLEDQDTFDNLMKNDSSFKSQVEKTQAANEAIHQLGLIEISEKLNKIHDTKSRTKTQVKKISIGAGVLLLGAIITGYYTSRSDVSHKTTVLSEEKVFSNLKEETPQVIIESKKEVEKRSIQETVITEEVLKTTEIEDTNRILPLPNEDATPENESLKREIVTINEVQVEESKKEEVKVICPTITIVPIKVNSTCNGEANGSLEITQNTFQGGIGPYKIEVFDNYKNEVDYNYLSSGTYTLSAIDSKNCPSEIESYTIMEARCTQKLEVQLSPTYQENWEYPIVDNVDEYTVYVRDRSGNLVFKKEVDTSFDTAWDGTLNDGTTIKSGLYFLEVKSDLEELFVGTITVVQ